MELWSGRNSLWRSLGGCSWRRTHRVVSSFNFSVRSVTKKKLQ
jgi:hypothetical protein